jgi:hypothetical protein
LFGLAVATVASAGYAADSPSAKEAASVIVDLIGHSDGPLDNALRDLGIPPQDGGDALQAWDNWERWPSVRKLDQAVRWANEYKPGQGDELLRAVARNIAGNYNDAIRYHSTLAQYFPEGTQAALRVEALPKFGFKMPTGAARTALPAGVRKVIIAISTHASTTYPGGAGGLISECCGYSVDEVYDILAEAASDRDAIERAIAEGRIPPELKARLLNAISEVGRFNAALASDQALSQYANLVDELSARDPVRQATARQALSEALAVETAAPRQQAVERADQAIGEGANENLSAFPAPRDPPPPTATAPAPNPTKPGGSPVGERLFASAMDSWYAEGKPHAVDSPTIDYAIERATGPGGIVLGSVAKLSSDMPSPIAAMWVPADNDLKSNSNVGRLAIAFNNDTVAYTQLFSAEEFYASRAMIFGQSESGVVRAPGLATEHAMIIASINSGRVSHFVLGSHPAIQLDGTLTKVVLNPAIADLKLGRDLLVADSVPGWIDLSMIRGLQETSAVTEAEADALRRFSKDLASRGYRIFDRPVTIRLAGYSTIRGLAQGADGSPVEESVLLNLRALDNSSETTQAVDSFASAAPVIIRLFPQFAELNNLAELSAVMRWLKEAGLEQIKGAVTLKPTFVVGLARFGEPDENFLPPKRTYRFFPPSSVALSDLSIDVASRSSLIFKEAKSPAALVQLNSNVESWRRNWVQDSNVVKLASGTISVSDFRLTLDQRAELISSISPIRSEYRYGSPSDEVRFADRDEAIGKVVAIWPFSDNTTAGSVVQESSRGAHPLSSPRLVIEETLLEQINPSAAIQYKGYRSTAEEIRKNISADDATIQEFNDLAADLTYDSSDDFDSRLQAIIDKRDAQLVAEASDAARIGQEIEADKQSVCDWLNSLQSGIIDKCKNVIELNLQLVDKRASISAAEEAADGLLRDQLPGFDEWYDLQMSYESAASSMLADEVAGPDAY